MEFSEQLKQRQIETMQLSLRQLRLMLNIGVQEFSDIVGLSRQSVNNLESGKVKMNAVQYLAICAVLDHFIESQPENIPIMCSILNSNDTMYDGELYGELPGNSLVRKWFSTFPDNSKVTIHGLDVVTDLVRSYKVFLDDTALCRMDGAGRVEELICGIQSASKKFFVPLIAIEMLQMRLNNDDLSQSGQQENDLLLATRNGINNLHRLQMLDVVDIRGEKEDYSVSTTLESVFVKFRNIHRMALITQNRKLAERILRCNNDRDDGFPVMALRITEDSDLKRWDEVNDEKPKTSLKKQPLYESGHAADEGGGKTQSGQQNDLSSWGIIN